MLLNNGGTRASEHALLCRMAIYRTALFYDAILLLFCLFFKQNGPVLSGSVDDLISLRGTRGFVYEDYY